MVVDYIMKENIRMESMNPEGQFVSSRVITIIKITLL